MSLAIAGAGEAAAYLTPDPTKGPGREPDQEKVEAKEALVPHARSVEPRLDQDVRAAEAQQDFKLAVLSAVYTGKGSVVDTMA